jgi:hypothetical protein
MKDKLAIVFIIFISLILLAATLRGVSGNPEGSQFKNNLDQTSRPFELSPERGRFVHLIALAQTGSYELSEQLAQAAYPDVGQFQGHLYSYFAPGIPYLDLPFYLLGFNYNLSQVFSFAFISLISIASLLFLFKIARRIFHLPLWASILVDLIFLFGSIAWSYAITLYQHHLTTFFILSSVYAVWKYRQKGTTSWLWASFIWINYGLAIMVDYPNALLLLPIMIYFFISAFNLESVVKGYKFSFRLSFLATMLFFIAITGLHLAHNVHYYGAWYHLSGSLADYKLPTDTPTEEIISQTSQTKDLTSFFSEQSLVRGLSVLLVSVERGLFYYAPIFILALLAIYFLLRRPLGPTTKTLLAVVVVNLFVYASWGDPWGGWAYGPRYLIPSMAILSLFIGWWLARVSRTLVAKILTFVLFLYSSAIALLGALTTNAIPTKLEAKDLDNIYDYHLNLILLSDNRSGSFIYNTWLNNLLDLKIYYLLIYAFLIIIVFLIMFIFSRYEERT